MAFPAATAGLKCPPERYPSARLAAVSSGRDIRVPGSTARTMHPESQCCRGRGNASWTLLTRGALRHEGADRLKISTVFDAGDLD